MDAEKAPYITANVDKETFGNIYRQRCIVIDFEPNPSVILKNEFVRIKTPFNNEWYADFKIDKIVVKNNQWQIFLGEKLLFFARGTKEVRWFQKNYVNVPSGMIGHEFRGNQYVKKQKK